MRHWHLRRKEARRLRHRHLRRHQEGGILEVDIKEGISNHRLGAVLVKDICRLRLAVPEDIKGVISSGRLKETISRADNRAVTSRAQCLHKME